MKTDFSSLGDTFGNLLGNEREKETFFYQIISKYISTLRASYSYFFIRTKLRHEKRSLLKNNPETGFVIDNIY